MRCRKSPWGRWRKSGPELSATPAHDPVNRPAHYTKHPSGVECIDIVEHLNFNRGSAIKYIWRAGEKGNILEDLRKAEWYVRREIARIEAAEKRELKAAFEKDGKPRAHMGMHPESIAAIYHGDTDDNPV